MEETKRRRFIIRAVLEGEVDVQDTPAPVPHYVTDGLIHRWDAIDNTGTGHSAAATVWKDLVGEYDLNIHGTEITWGDDYVQFTGDTASFFYSDENDVEDPSGKTVEIVMIPESASTGCVGQFFYQSGHGNDARGKIVLYSDLTWASQGMSARTWESGVNSLSDLKYVGATFTSTGAVSEAYANGAEVAQSANTHSLRYSINRMLVGGQMQSWSGSPSIAYPFVGKVKAIRIYNRELTAEEIAQNHSADVAIYGI